jgi:hypothetical protein
VAVLGQTDTAFTLTRTEDLQRPRQSGAAPIGRQFAVMRHPWAEDFPGSTIERRVVI